MLSTSRKNVQDLLDQSGVPGMVVSCYANVSVVEGFNTHWSPRLKAEATKVRELLADDHQGLVAFEQQLERIRQVLESPEVKNAQGIAVFSATGLAEPVVFTRDEPVEDQLVIDEQPFVAPLLLADLRRREYLVVVFDSHHAQLYAAAPGRSRLLEELDDGLSRGERTHADDRRHDALQMQFLREVGQNIEKQWDEYSYSGLILIGLHEQVEQLKTALPERVLPHVHAEARHAAHQDRAEVAEAVERTLRSVIDGQNSRLLDDVAERFRQGSAVALGAQEVIEAIGNGQVATLLIGQDAGEVGARCRGCGSRFAAEEETCPYCRSTCVRVSLYQEILQFATHHGIDVHLIDGPNPLPTGTTYAALLRRDEPQWASAAKAENHAR